MKKAKSKSSSTSILEMLPKELTTVSTLSKAVAVIVFITLPFLGFLLGIRYQQFASTVEQLENMYDRPPITIKNDQSVCPLDTLMCSNGTYVNRISPSCEFAACPAN